MKNQSWSTAIKTQSMEVRTDTTYRERLQILIRWEPSAMNYYMQDDKPTMLVVACSAFNAKYLQPLYLQANHHSISVTVIIKEPEPCKHTDMTQQ